MRRKDHAVRLRAGSSALTYYREAAAAGDVEMRLHSGTLYASLFRYDDEIMVNPHAFGEAASAIPVAAPSPPRRRRGRRSTWIPSSGHRTPPSHGTERTCSKWGELST
jgi:hypothetical protein